MLARRLAVAIAAEEAVTERTDAWVRLASTTASHYARRTSWPRRWPSAFGSAARRC